MTKDSSNSKPKDNEARAYDALQHEYKGMASWYDSFWVDYLTKTFQFPLRLLLTRIEKLQEKGREEDSSPVSVVDIGCGTGEFLLRAKKALSTEKTAAVHFYGVEPSPEMLAEARKKDTQIQWIESAAESVPLEDSSAHIVCCTSAFHFFRNKNLALNEIHRILRPGGQLIITDWSADYFLVRLYHLLELLRWNFRFSHWYPGPLSSKNQTQILQEAGFQNVGIETYTIRFWTVIIWGMQTVTAQK